MKNLLKIAIFTLLLGGCAEGDVETFIVAYGTTETVAGAYYGSEDTYYDYPRRYRRPPPRHYRHPPPRHNRHHHRADQPPMPNREHRPMPHRMDRPQRAMPHRVENRQMPQRMQREQRAMPKIEHRGQNMPKMGHRPELRQNRAEIRRPEFKQPNNFSGIRKH